MSQNNSPAVNQPTAVAQQPKFSAMVSTKGWQTLINNTLRDPKRANNFVAAITSAVVTNPELQKCENATILSGALLGESLGLCHSPQMGQYYLVPFKRKAKIDKHTGAVISPETTVAQFVLGYKGYIQLALRTGYYKKLVVLEIKQGEFGCWDPLNETLECMMIDDPEARENAPTVGYYAMFEYMNGFRKTMYWSKDKMLRHADLYSPAFSAQALKKLEAGEIPNNELWKYSSFWYKDFDGMAKKTMVRQLITHWGMTSTELASAMEADDTIRDIVDGKPVGETEEPILEATGAFADAQYESGASEAAGEPETVNIDSL